MSEVMAESEFKRIIPIIPTTTHPGTDTAINTIPAPSKTQNPALCVLYSNQGLSSQSGV